MVANTPYQAGYKAPHTVLLIGVSDYSSGDTIPSLPGVAADIQHVQRAFETLNQSADADPLKPKYEIIPILNRDATASGIRAALRKLQVGTDAYKDDATRERAVIIYLSGHGVIRETRDGLATAYFVPYDYDPDRKDWDTLVTLDSILDTRHFMAAKHVLFIFGCCYGGMSLMHSPLTLRAEPIYWVRSADQELSAVPPSPADKPLERFTTHRAYQVLTAGNFDEEVSDVWTYEQRVHNVPLPRIWLMQSPFNVALCAGLLGAAADDFGFTTADRLAYYVRQRLLTEQHYNATLPRFGYLPGHEGGDLVLGKPDVIGPKPAPQYRVINRRKGVISLISPSSATALEMIGRDKPQWEGIDYHRLNQNEMRTESNMPATADEDGYLTHLWLIYTDESSSVAERMEHYYKTAYPNGQLTIRLCLVNDPYNIAETQNVIEAILKNEVPAAHLTLDQIVLDVTGSTTPMSIGSALAAHAQQPHVAMQYCSINHLSYSGGRPNTSRRTKTPIWLHTAQDILDPVPLTTL